MKTAYMDCSMGVSGDMLLGALMDAGAPLSAIKKGLRALPAGGYTLSTESVTRGGISAVRAMVKVRKNAVSPSKWAEVRKVLKASELPEYVRENSLLCFKRIFEAEAKVHGKSINRVHLHELSSPDAFVDIVGTFLCLQRLGIKRVYGSAVNVGSGTVKCMHGVLPVPAPATVELLKGVPIYSDGPLAELATPTGAALLATVCEGFGRMPLIELQSTGSGAGGREFPDRPNVLRVFIGEGDFKEKCSEGEDVVVLETNLDDQSPELFEHLMERLFCAGALDVWFTGITMKKSRPGVVVSVLGQKGAESDLAEILFMESSTLGIRVNRMERVLLKRKLYTVRTKYGSVGIKRAILPDGTFKDAPEYEDCRRAALKSGVPLRVVMEAVLRSVR